MSFIGVFVICSQSSQSSQIIKYGCAAPAFFSHYPLLFTTLLPTFRYFIYHFSMSLKDNFGGMYRKGGVLYYTICAHTPETQKCVNFVNFVNNWQKYQCKLIVNMQLLRFFSYSIAFFSDFMHFTLKLFKNLYYLCTAIQNHHTLIARSSRYHRTHIHV